VLVLPACSAYWHAAPPVGALSIRPYARLLWREEIVRARHPEAYRAAGPATMSFDEVAAIVARYDSDF
jgi:hypothetical protein